MNLLFIIFISIEGIEADAVVHQLFPNLGLEPFPLVQSQAVTLGNDRDHIDDLAQLLHHNHIDRAQRVASGIDEVQAAVDTRVLDIAVTHSSQLLAQVCRVLVLDVLDDRVPANQGISSAQEFGYG